LAPMARSTTARSTAPGSSRPTNTAGWSRSEPPRSRGRLRGDEPHVVALPHRT
jgi:hypothetical protein